ncbi:MAG: hypothetical protein GY896_23045 [Gammaproteobacteria bacterium]|nr:hypothetical protein [Gammaproteobacteria bacterium]
MTTVLLGAGGGGGMDHNTLLNLIVGDPHTQYALLAGRTGGQTLYGGGPVFGDLTLQGRNSPSTGIININSPMVLGPYVPSEELYSVRYSATETFTNNFIGGGVNMSGDLTFDIPVFIYESFRASPTINSNATPSFAAWTALQALATLNSGPSAGHNPLPPLVVNAGPRIRHAFSGARTVPNVTGLNFVAILNGAVSGGTLTVNNWRGLIFGPTWDTVSGATIDFGTIIGVQCRAPVRTTFGQSFGTERMAAYYGLQMADPTISNAVGTAPVAAVHSLVNAGTNKYFLLNAGTADSDFGAGDILFDDDTGLVLGDSADVRVEWSGAEGVLDFNPAVGEDLFFAFGLDGSKPTYLFEAETFGDSETDYTQIRFGFDRYAFGQTASIGNQVGLFIAGNRTAEVGGGWSDYLLTQAGGLNIGTFAMSDVAAWTINQISLDNTAGSITSLDTLVVGGMTISNPGITVTERSALRITGRLKQRGSIQYPPINPSALSAGDNDDWAGLLTASPSNNGRYWARVTGNATTSKITGIDATAVQDGDTFELTNVGAETILLAHQDTGSVAANRIIVETSNPFSIAEDQTVSVRYDGTTSRWRIITPAGAVLPLGSIWKSDTGSTTMADPGNTFFRLNNATLASVTALAFSVITFKEGDATNFFNSLDAGDQLIMQQRKDKGEYATFTITGITDNTTWFQIDVTVNESGNNFTDNKEFQCIFVYA